MEVLLAKELPYYSKSKSFSGVNLADLDLIDWREYKRRWVGKRQKGLVPAIINERHHSGINTTTRLLIQSHVVHSPNLLNTTRSQRERTKARGSYSPTSRQCFSIRRDNATFSPISVHAGDVSCIFAKSARTLNTRPPVDVEPILINNNSPLTSFATFVCFLSSVFTPSSRRNKNKLISNSR